MSPTQQHRFQDEWLLPLVEKTHGLSVELLAEWRGQKRRFLSQALVDQGLATFEELGEAILRRYRIKYGAPGADSITRDVFSVVPEKVCRKHGLIPASAERREVLVLMANPVDPTAQQEVEWAAGRDVVPVFCLPDHLERLLVHMLAPDAVVYDLLQRLELEAQVDLMGTDQEPEETAPGEVRAPVIRLANAIIADGVKRGASDIHLEQEENATVVRYRIDGILRKTMVLPRYIGAGPLVSRVKIMAGLDLAERRRPQDGRIKLRIDGVEIGFRVSTLPTRLGEKIVFRILDERSAQVPLERLGFHADVCARLEALIRKEEGILLVTGPTGSGKTTTLYSILNKRNSEDVNIVTVEDPVEYRLQGISQVQVNEKQGLTFASVLRSMLRQDPDVVMVGEIRDAETADIACQAALTGHMVLSTLHTNDAVTAVARLADMDVERFKLASGLNGVTAQRLVRRVCRECSRVVEATKLSRELDAALRSRGLPTEVREAVGCAQCDHTGYKGRLSVLELLEVPEALRERIAAGAGTEELRAEALQMGCLHTMTEDILRHLALGTTTFEEVEGHLELGQIGPVAAQPAVAQAALAAGSPAPVAPAAGAAAAASRPGVAPSRSTAVLLVGDAQDRETVASALAGGDVEAFVAESGQAAVAMVAKAEPDLMVVGPPTATVDAEGLIGLIRTVLGLRSLPILALAATEEEGDALLRAGADDCLVVPLRPTATQARLRSVLGRRDAWTPPEELARPRIPAIEGERLAELHALNILDTPPEDRFDRLTRQAAEHFGVPMSMVSLVDEDRQWWKSRHGTVEDGTPRDVSFCGHAILGDETFVIEDAYLDARFVNNPLVTGESQVRFYAGYPMKGPSGQNVGAFCIVDRKPRRMSPEDIRFLEGLGRQAAEELAR